ncbi:hypothetical protein HMI56_002203 [Coelomomyces lativittatus]|nr:hypothetical protein HMI56_002203 [Coelomomyces lativittatus]
MVMDLVVHSEELKQDRENMQKELKKWENEALQSKQRLSGIDDEIKNKNARLKEGEVYITQLLETENMHTQSISTLEDKLATQLEGIQELKRENALLSESLKASQQKIEEIKKQYKDTVPKYEHELLLAEYTSYKSRFEQQQDLTMKMIASTNIGNPKEARAIFT